MKNLFFSSILICLLNFTNAQCINPTNFSIINSGFTEATLDWTENGIANTWEIAITPNYIIGSPTPNEPTLATVNHPYTITGLSFPNCYVFYVRSVCSFSDKSNWVPIASSDCSLATISYVSSLSNNNFKLTKNNFKIFPNPAENDVSIKFQSQYNNVVIELYDLTGRLVELFTTNDTKGVWTANISNLTSGIYTVVIKEEGKITIQEKLVKK
jgi:Secretion system C-terminal sorting domain